MYMDRETLRALVVMIVQLPPKPQPPPQLYGPQQANALDYLIEYGRCEASVIGAAFGVSDCTVHGWLKGLREKGYVRSWKSRRDGRFTVWEITDRGRWAATQPQPWAWVDETDGRQMA